MKKYTIMGIGTYSVNTGEIIEAKNANEAVEKAKGSSPMLCHHCAHEVELHDIYEYQAEEEQ